MHDVPVTSTQHIKMASMHNEHWDALTSAGYKLCKQTGLPPKGKLPESLAKGLYKDF